MAKKHPQSTQTPSKGGETHQQSSGNGAVLSTNQGLAIADN